MSEENVKNESKGYWIRLELTEEQIEALKLYEKKYDGEGKAMIRFAAAAGLTDILRSAENNLAIQKEEDAYKKTRSASKKVKVLTDEYVKKYAKYPSGRAEYVFLIADGRYTFDLTWKEARESAQIKAAELGVGYAQLLGQ